MELKSFVLTVLLVSLSATLFFAFVYDMGDTYSVSVPANYRETFDAFSPSVNTTFEAGKEFEKTANKVEEGAILGGAITGGGAVLKILLLPFTMIADVHNFIFRFGQLVGIPKAVLFTAYTAILIVLSFLFIEAVLRFKKI